MVCDSGLPSFREIRAALDARGFRPSKRLGQNFLLDHSLHGVIVEAGRVRPGEAVVEIGSGPGFLTAGLLAAGARVLAVEVDSRLVEVAGEVLGDREGLTLLQGDVLAGKNRLDPQVLARMAAHANPGEPLKVVANLPYSISGPVLALLTTAELNLETLVVLVQKEMAHRLLAEPGGREWGALGLAVRLRYAPEYLRTVPPQVFRPRPRVDSGLVRLQRLAAPHCPAGPAAAELLALGRTLFTQRRRTLAAALRTLGLDPGGGRLARAGLAGGLRVQQLGPPELLALAAAGEGGSGGDR